MQRIIFKNVDNSVSILIPTQEAIDLFGIEAIALKDTPRGLPFWIVSVNDIPTDRTTREAWIADETSLGVPNGIGHTLDTFEGIV